MRMQITINTWKKAIEYLFSKKLWPSLIGVGFGISILSTVLLYFFINPVTQKIMPDRMHLSEHIFLTDFPIFSILNALVTFLVIIELSILAIIAFHIITRKYFHTNNDDIWKKTLQAFIPFHFYLFRIFWYIAWPIFIASITIGILLFLDIPFVPILGMIAICAVTIYRSLSVSFSFAFFFENPEKKKEENFNNSILFAQKNLLRIFLSELGFRFLIGIIGFIIILLITFTSSTPIEEITMSSPFSFFGAINIIIGAIFAGPQKVFMYSLYKSMESESQRDNKEKSVRKNRIAELEEKAFEK